MKNFVPFNTQAKLIANLINEDYAFYRDKDVYLASDFKKYVDKFKELIVEEKIVLDKQLIEPSLIETKMFFYEGVITGIIKTEELFKKVFLGRNKK